MSLLTLAMLLWQPWPANATGESLRRWIAPHVVVLLAVLVTACVALTGGMQSPEAPLVVLLGVAPARKRAEPHWGVSRAWVAGVSACVCMFAAALIALPSAVWPTELAPTVERGIVLGLCAGAVSHWQRCLLAADARAADLRRLAAQVRTEALALERARGEMLAHVSHELLAPLAVIRSGAGLLGALAREGLGAGERAQLERRGTSALARTADSIVRSSARLELSVHDLLELARLEEGHASLVPAWHDCQQLFDRAVEQLVALLEIKHQRVTVVIAGTNQVVWGDGRRLERVVTNLLANAHKYAGEGASITLRASSDANATCLAVQDDGPGVTPDVVARLFDRYYRAPGAAGHGSGLGLAIVQAEVALHGGRVWAESLPERGCRFVCTFPYPRQADFPVARPTEVSI
jgi:signal transduction histidine kinase